MIPLHFLKEKTVAVLGLGKTGTAVVDALRAADAHVVVWDDNIHARSTFSVDRKRHIAIEPPQQWHWDAIDLLVMSPGLPYTHPKPHAGVALAQQHDVPIVGDIELLYQACPDAWYIGITGTNGKSTTTSLIAHIIRETKPHVQLEVGGNIGKPVMAMEPLGKDGIYVLELSSYQLDLVRTTVFDTAILLNISPDHLDRHGDMDGYIAAKKHIFDRQTFRSTEHPKGKTLYAVVGVDDSYSEAIAHEIKDRSYPVLIPITTQKSEGQVLSGAGGIINDPTSDQMIDITQAASLQGTHNHQNAIAAYAACHYGLMIPQADIDKAMHSFGGLAHRMQLVAKVNGVTFINDSKATNADAAAKSLGTYESIHWIAGGVAKEGGIESLASFFPRIKHAYLIGKAQKDFAKTLEGHVEYSVCDTLDKAVEVATRNAHAGDVILLAPACASFDQFPNFEVRGEQFVTLIDAWKQTSARAHAI